MKITIMGVFDEDDLRSLLEAVRKIEQRRPEVNYVMTAENSETSIKEAEEIVRRIFPRLPGEEPVFGVVKKSTDS